jgi:hypothetical protein
MSQLRAFDLTLAPDKRGGMFVVCGADKSWIACFNCSALRKLAPDKACRVKMPNQISTWLNQLAEVGVKWKVTLGCAASQVSFLLWVRSCRG